MSYPRYFQKNVIFNVAGKASCAGIMLLSIPIFVHRLGIESYGIIGLFTIIQAVFSLMDLGLSRSLNREIASQVATNGGINDLGDVLRTTEAIYWGMAIVLCVLLMSASSFIGRYWIRRDTLYVGEIIRAIRLMGLVMLFQWPQSLYFGGLQGLQKHLSYNLMNVLSYVLRYAGGAAVIFFVSNSISAFFFWQVIASLICTAATALVLWRAMPKGAGRAKTRFRFLVLRRIWKYAMGLSGISVTVLLLSQLDKLILSHRLSLKAFGFYTLAGNAAGILSIFTTPVFITIFPLLTSYAAKEDQSGLASAYHQGSQLISFVVVPLSLTLSLFSYELLRIWFSDASVSINVYKILSVLVIGNGLNSLVSVPYALQLSTGWTTLALFSNIVAVLIFLPMLLLLVPGYGGLGAAFIWALLNIGYLIANVNIMHRRLLTDQKTLWYRKDVIEPTLIALAVLLPTRLLVSRLMPTTPLFLLVLGFAYAVVTIVLASRFGFVKIKLPRVAFNR